MSLPEREFFNEQQESKPATFVCPKCQHRDEYQVRWIKRTKKGQLPRGADGHDRALFAKLRDYLVRLDDLVVCKRCGRRFDIPSQQSVVFI